MKSESVSTYVVDIFVSGPTHLIEAECSKYCLDVGLCVSVSRVKYIYTGGIELGSRVTLLNYPRFPSSEARINMEAEELAKKILVATHQRSALVVTPKRTVWYTLPDNENHD